MLTWVVIFSRHPRRSTLFRRRDEKPVSASPLESALVNRDARNSFGIRFYENCRVSCPLRNIFVTRLTSPRKCAFANLLFSLRYALFQVPHPATPLFATLTKTTGVYTNNSHSGTPHPYATTSILVVSFHALTNCPSHNPFLLTFMPRMGGVGVSPTCPRFVSQPYICLVNYLDPIFPGAGPVGSFLHSAQRPRSRA